MPSHLPTPTGWTGRSTIELSHSNPTTRRPFGFSRALPSTSPAGFIEKMAQQLRIEDTPR